MFSLVPRKSRIISHERILEINAPMTESSLHFDEASLPPSSVRGQPHIPNKHRVTRRPPPSTQLPSLPAEVLESQPDPRYKGRDMSDPSNLYPYYTKLINNAFRELQLDSELGKMLLVDLMDYCELLYERHKTNPGYYLNGFIILNYFINSYIMMKYEGFDRLIAVSNIDFVAYLTLFSIYINNDEILSNAELAYPEIALLQLRTLILEYLVKNQLLSFDVNELYDWLYLYIDYLHQRDKHEALGDGDVASINETAVVNTSPHSKLELDDDSFTKKYPPVKNAYPRDSFCEISDADSDSDIDFKSESNRKARSSLDLVASKKIPLPYPLDVTEEVTNITPFIGETTPILPRNTTEPVLNLDPDIKLARTSTEPILSLSERPPQTIPPIPKTQVFYSRVAAGAPAPAKIPSNARPLPTNNESAQSLSTNSANGDRRNQYRQQPNIPPNQYYSPQQQLQPPWPQQPFPINPAPQQFPPGPYYQGPQFPPQQQMVVGPYMNGYAPAMNGNPYKTYGICGLKNFGSSCYINLTIQVLFGLYYFKSLIRSLDLPRSPNSLAASILGLLSVFTKKGNSNITPSNFIRTVKNLKPGFNVPYEQQDAQEFLIFVLDQLHIETSFKPLKTPLVDLPTLTIQKDKDEYAKWYDDLVKFEGLSPIHDLFQGHLQSKLICYKCGYESVSYSSFTILSLPIPSSGSIVNLSDCLMYYTQDEVLRGDNAWKCPKCTKEVDPQEGHKLDNNPVFHVKKSGMFKLRRSKSPSKEPAPVKLKSSAPELLSFKRLTFIKLPKILFIHLSRFSNMQNKLTVPIKFPLKLTFRHEAAPVVYHLVGVINHFGSLKSGHYISIVNKMLDSNFHELNPETARPPPQGWYLFDDENIVNTNMGHNESVESRDAYVLCYERM